MAISRMYAPLKRSMDLLGSSVACALGWPLMLGSAVAVRTSMGSPVFFVQERAGKDGRSFHILKFRTMLDTRDADGELLPDAERITVVGNVMRKFSLDELPQLLNVLKGEMSLVGPRPLPVRYLTRYSPEQGRRHEVHPGITGWAQVNGRSSVSWDDKFCFDVWYVDNISLLTDAKILVLTVLKVVRGSDTFGAGNEEFWGSVAR